MTLYINTTLADEIIIAFKKRDKLIFFKRIKVHKNQAEKLLPAIDHLLQEQNIKLSSLRKIVVANMGGSFTSLRIGVITANALAYALKIPVEAEKVGVKKNKKFFGYSLVVPVYDREPNIGIAKRVDKNTVH